MPNPGEYLTAEPFDLLVVGGGIHGLFAALDAARRGWRVALVDKGDIGSGLSFNHQRTIHGGLRALERGQWRKAHAQILERRAWAVLAPHLLRPLPFLIGTYRGTKRSRLLLRAGLRAYDVIGRHRNVGVTPELHLPASRLESSAATRRLFPGIAPNGLTGGAAWYDYQTIHPDRLTWLVASAAADAGAHVATYVEVTGPAAGASGTTAVAARDTVTGETFDIRARAVLLAAGAGARSLFAAFGLSGAPPLLRAVNLLLNRPARDIAVAAPASTGRMLTAVPWRQRVLVGTFQSGLVEPTAASSPSDGDIATFLAEANSAFPSLGASPADVLLVHHGLVPAVERGARADLLGEPVIRRHNGDGAPAIVSLIGVKYTTAREAAMRAVVQVAAVLDRPARPHGMPSGPLPHADVADAEGRLVETLRDIGVTLDRDVLSHLVSWYGTEAPAVVRFARSAGQLERLDGNGPVIAGEIGYAVQHLRVRRLSDVVLRRTALGSAGHPGDVALDRAAAIMATARGWSPAASALERAAVEEAYRGAGPVIETVTERRTPGTPR